jgi:dolichyl-phosphate-mannose-protein mannosyltransferase
LASLAGGRDFPGRLLLARSERWDALLGAACLGALVLATRVPLRTRYLLNWDADQFALGLRHFDIVHHQPHPPGYPGFELLGRVLLPLLGDANATRTALSVAGEVAGVVLAFGFARSLFGRTAGWVAALALVTSPLFWYYGEAGDTYGLEPGLALAIAWPSWLAWNGSRRAAVVAGAVLALAGSLRPSTAVLLAPLLLASLVRLGDRRAALRSLAAAALLTAGWVVPLLVAAGGPEAYLRASLDLGESVTTSTAIWKAGLDGLRTTGSAVILGTTWELGAFSLLALFGLGIAPRLLRAPATVPPGWALFCWTWALPALAVFLLVHIGQVVYVQVFAVALFLSLGPALDLTCRALARPRLWRPVLATALAANVAIFFFPAKVSLAGQLEQNDRHLAVLTAAVTAYDPSSTVLVVDAYASGTYRSAQVYLPAYHRVAISRDERGQPGLIFGDAYQPENLARARQLSFPPGTTTYLFLDRGDVFGLVGDPDRFQVVRLADGSQLYVWRGPAPSVVGHEIWLGPPYDSRRGALP